MLLRSHSCQRLEPVGIMGSALFDRPFLHFMGNDICHLQRQLLALQDGLFQILIDFLRKALLHHRVVEHVFAEYFSYICIFTHML